MIEHRTEQSSPEHVRGDESGFTLIEVLVVIIVLGILAALVVFALRGTSNQGVTAACDSNARTVSVAADAYLTEHPLVSQVTQNLLIATGTGTLPAWPTDSSSTYSIVIAGDGNALDGTTDASGTLIADNDVLVKIGASYYDATSSLNAACSTA